MQTSVCQKNVILHKKRQYTPPEMVPTYFWACLLIIHALRNKFGRLFSEKTFQNTEQYYLWELMEVEILAISMKPHNIYSLVSQLRYFARSSIRIVSVLIISQEKILHFHFIRKLITQSISTVYLDRQIIPRDPFLKTWFFVRWKFWPQYF